VFVGRDQAGALEAALLALLPAVPDAETPPLIAGRLQALLNQAAGMGGRVHRPGPGRPAILADARTDMPLLQQDVFAPWLAILPVSSMDQALRDDALCPFALGASIFGPVAAARPFAARVRAGSVCINDLIVPTADPRLPFGGSARSGFGRTRGASGLLEFTQEKAISIRRGWFRPHLQVSGEADAGRFATMCRVLHGGWGGG
jgi:acyl-CoA reductase-like NAD-dependent aldehyde dehydrogenase